MADQTQNNNQQSPDNPEIEKLRAELGTYQKKAEEYLDAWKRCAADFENYKKRRAREDQELLTFARELTILKVLPALEALEQALTHAPKDEQYQKWSEGVIKIVQELEKALWELGVEKIKTVGEKFNHQLHEAVEMVEREAESGQIVEEVAAGYKINGKVIRPAKVKVAK